MELKTYKTLELNWDLDFRPLKPWPSVLPLVAVEDQGQIKVITGFERRHESLVEVLILRKSLTEAIEQLWPLASLGALERLRLQKILNLQTEQDFLLDWPLEFQTFIDQKQLSLKSLKPLEYLTPWMKEVGHFTLQLEPSSSQCREIFDLLCDLKLNNVDWAPCQPLTHDPHLWVKQLKALRNPQTTHSDSQSNLALLKVSWPRGINVKWERQGDQAGLVLQTRVTNQLEWKRLAENLPKIELGEGFWQS